MPFLASVRHSKTVVEEPWKSITCNSTEPVNSLDTLTGSGRTGFLPLGSLIEDFLIVQTGNQLLGTSVKVCPACVVGSGWCFLVFSVS